MRRPRLTIRLLMGIVAASALALTLSPLVGIALFHRGYFLSNKTVSLIITAVDDATGAPIPGATIRVVHPAPSGLFPPSIGKTGADGRVVLTAYPKASGRVLTVSWNGGRPAVLWIWERVSFSGGSMDASSPDYEAASTDLDGDVVPAMIRLRPSTKGRPVSRSGR